jgi:hypothetical protein
MQNFILYQAHSGIDHINECRYSLLKYLEVYNLKPPANIGFIIYTDQPALFEIFTPFFHYFELKEISTNQIQEWMGQARLSHRVKLEILREFLDHVTGNLLYLDSDTYITGPINHLFADLAKGDFYLHQYRGTLDKPVSQHLSHLGKFLAGSEIAYNNKKVSFSYQQGIWDTAVIGINSQAKELIHDVLALTDTAWNQHRRRSVEQYAFSYCFTHAGEVKTAQQIEHFNDLKEFRALLRKFFQKNEEESVPNLVKLVHHLDAATIRKSRNKFEALPFYIKWFQTLMGNKWSIKQYEKKI